MYKNIKSKVSIEYLLSPFILNMKENLERKKSHIKKRDQLRPLSKKYDMCFELTNIQDIQEVLLHLKTLYLRC